MKKTIIALCMVLMLVIGMAGCGPVITPDIDSALTERQILAELQTQNALLEHIIELLESGRWVE